MTKSEEHQQMTLDSIPWGLNQRERRGRGREHEEGGASYEHPSLFSIP